MTYVRLQACIELVCSGTRLIASKQYGPGPLVIMNTLMRLIYYSMCIVHGVLLKEDNIGRLTTASHCVHERQESWDSGKTHEHMKICDILVEFYNTVPRSAANSSHNTLRGFWVTWSRIVGVQPHYKHLIVGTLRS